MNGAMVRTAVKSLPKRRKKIVRKPFVGAIYERNTPFHRPFSDEYLAAPRCTIIDNDTEYFGCPGVLVLMPWNPEWGPEERPSWKKSDEVRLNLEQFLEQWHPIDNVQKIF